MDTLLEYSYLTTAQIEARMEDVLASPGGQGILRMIVRRPKINAREVVGWGRLDVIEGLVGDNWLKKGSRWRRGGDPMRQLTLMNWRFARLVAGGKARIPLAGDQLYVDLDLSKENLRAGTQLTVGNAVIEVTAPPHLGCKKFVDRFGMDAMTFANSEFGRSHNLRGINAKIIASGDVFTGDAITVIAE